MGLLDNVGGLAGLAGALSGNSGGGALGNAALLGGLVNMLGGSQSGGGLAGGGLASILSGLQSSGLGDAVSSWVSTGQNQAITPDQLHQGLGADRVRELAKHAGLSEGDAASALSGLLPMVVDKLTPNGAMPSASELPQLLNALKGFLG